MLNRGEPIPAPSRDTSVDLKRARITNAIAGQDIKALLYWSLTWLTFDLALQQAQGDVVEAALTLSKAHVCLGVIKGAAESAIDPQTIKSVLTKFATTGGLARKAKDARSAAMAAAIKRDF